MIPWNRIPLQDKREEGKRKKREEARGSESEFRKEKHVAKNRENKRSRVKSMSAGNAG